MKNQDETSPLVNEPQKENTIGTELNNHTPTHAEPLSVSLIREFDEIKNLVKESRKTKLQQWTSHPAFLVMFTFIFTVCGYMLNSFLTGYQQHRAAERSFIDESNKLRIQKIGEVWEQLDQNEHTIDQLLEADDDIKAKFPTVNDRVKEIERIIRSDRAKVSMYRFWLGQVISDKINNYLNANIKYSIGKLSGNSETDLKPDKEARDAAKSDVDKIREELLSGVPQSKT